MIRNEKEYKEAIKKVKQDQAVISKQEEALQKRALSPVEIKRVLDPLMSFHHQLLEEVEWYERVKRKDFAAINSLDEMGRLLIALRIASGLTQKDLAKCTGVTEAQVSRDEKNEYHGISIDRAQKIIKIFGVNIETKVAIDGPLERKKILAAAG